MPLWARIWPWLWFFAFACTCVFRFKHIDPDTGIETRQKFSDSRKDVYPISMVQNKEGIQGSCALFKQRKDVTKNVRSESLTPIVNLQEAFERFVDFHWLQTHSIVCFFFSWLFLKRSVYVMQWFNIVNRIFTELNHLNNEHTFLSSKFEVVVINFRVRKCEKHFINNV